MNSLFFRTLLLISGLLTLSSLAYAIELHCTSTHLRFDRGISRFDGYMSNVISDVQAKCTNGYLIEVNDITLPATANAIDLTVSCLIWAESPVGTYGGIKLNGPVANSLVFDHHVFTHPKKGICKLKSSTGHAVDGYIKLAILKISKDSNLRQN